jgi:hypothetical protein
LDLVDQDETDENGIQYVPLLDNAAEKLKFSSITLINKVTNSALRQRVKVKPKEGKDEQPAPKGKVQGAGKTGNANEVKGNSTRIQPTLPRILRGRQRRIHLGSQSLRAELVTINFILKSLQIRLVSKILSFFNKNEIYY